MVVVCYYQFILPFTDDHNFWKSFLCSLDIHISSLVMCCWNLLLTGYNSVLFSFKLSLYITNTSSLPEWALQIFYLVCCLYFQNLKSVFWRTVFNFHIANFINFSIMAYRFVSHLRNLCLTNGHKYFLPYIPPEVFVLALTFRSKMHFELFFYFSVGEQSRFIVLHKAI